MAERSLYSQVRKREASNQATTVAQTNAVGFSNAQQSNKDRNSSPSATTNYIGFIQNADILGQSHGMKQQNILENAEYPLYSQMDVRNMDMGSNNIGQGSLLQKEPLKIPSINPNRNHYENKKAARSKSGAKTNKNSFLQIQNSAMGSSNNGTNLQIQGTNPQLIKPHQQQSEAAKIILNEYLNQHSELLQSINNTNNQQKLNHYIRDGVKSSTGYNGNRKDDNINSSRLNYTNELSSSQNYANMVHPMNNGGSRNSNIEQNQIQSSNSRRTPYQQNEAQGMEQQNGNNQFYVSKKYINQGSFFTRKNQQNNNFLQSNDQSYNNFNNTSAIPLRRGDSGLTSEDMGAQHSLIGISQTVGVPIKNSQKNGNNNNLQQNKSVKLRSFTPNLRQYRVGSQVNSSLTYRGNLGSSEKAREENDSKMLPSFRSNTNSRENLGSNKYKFKQISSANKGINSINNNYSIAPLNSLPNQQYLTTDALSTQEAIFKTENDIYTQTLNDKQVYFLMNTNPDQLQQQTTSRNIKSNSMHSNTQNHMISTSAAKLNEIKDNSSQSSLQNNQNNQNNQFKNPSSPTSNSNGNLNQRPRSKQSGQRNQLKQKQDEKMEQIKQIYLKDNKRSRSSGRGSKLQEGPEGGYSQSGYYMADSQKSIQKQKQNHPLYVQQASHQIDDFGEEVEEIDVTEMFKKQSKLQQMDYNHNLQFQQMKVDKSNTASKQNKRYYNKDLQDSDQEEGVNNTKSRQSNLPPRGSQQVSNSTQNDMLGTTGISVTGYSLNHLINNDDNATVQKTIRLDDINDSFHNEVHPKRNHETAQTERSSTQPKNTSSIYAKVIQKITQNNSGKIQNLQKINGNYSEVYQNDSTSQKLGQSQLNNSNNMNGTQQGFRRSASSFTKNKQVIENPQNQLNQQKQQDSNSSKNISATKQNNKPLEGNRGSFSANPSVQNLKNIGDVNLAQTNNQVKAEQRSNSKTQIRKRTISQNLTSSSKKNNNIQEQIPDNPLKAETENNGNKEVGGQQKENINLKNQINYNFIKKDQKGNQEEKENKNYQHNDSYQVQKSDKNQKNSNPEQSTPSKIPKHPNDQDLKEKNTDLNNIFTQASVQSVISDSSNNPKKVIGHPTEDKLNSSKIKKQQEQVNDKQPIEQLNSQNKNDKTEKQNQTNNQSITNSNVKESNLVSKNETSSIQDSQSNSHSSSKLQIRNNSEQKSQKLNKQNSSQGKISESTPSTSKISSVEETNQMKITDNKNNTNDSIDQSQSSKKQNSKQKTLNNSHQKLSSKSNTSEKEKEQSVNLDLSQQTKQNDTLILQNIKQSSQNNEVATPQNSELKSNKSVPKKMEDQIDENNYVTFQQDFDCQEIKNNKSEKSIQSVNNSKIQNNDFKESNSFQEKKQVQPESQLNHQEEEKKKVHKKRISIRQDQTNQDGKVDSVKEHTSKLNQSAQNSNNVSKNSHKKEYQKINSKTESLIESDNEEEDYDEFESQEFDKNGAQRKKNKKLSKVLNNEDKQFLEDAVNLVNHQAQGQIKDRLSKKSSISSKLKEDISRIGSDLKSNKDDHSGINTPNKNQVDISNFIKAQDTSHILLNEEISKDMQNQTYDESIADQNSILAQLKSNQGSLKNLNPMNNNNQQSNQQEKQLPDNSLNLNYQEELLDESNLEDKNNSSNFSPSQRQSESGKQFSNIAEITRQEIINKQENTPNGNNTSASQAKKLNNKYKEILNKNLVQVQRYPIKETEGEESLQSLHNDTSDELEQIVKIKILHDQHTKNTHSSYESLRQSRKKSEFKNLEFEDIDKLKTNSLTPEEILDLHIQQNRKKIRKINRRPHVIKQDMEKLIDNAIIFDIKCRIPKNIDFIEEIKTDPRHGELAFGRESYLLDSAPKVRAFRGFDQEMMKPCAVVQYFIDQFCDPQIVKEWHMMQHFQYNASIEENRFLNLQMNTQLNNADANGKRSFHYGDQSEVSSSYNIFLNPTLLLMDSPLVFEYRHFEYTFIQEVEDFYPIEQIMLNRFKERKIYEENELMFIFTSLIECLLGYRAKNICLGNVQIEHVAFCPASNSYKFFNLTKAQVFEETNLEKRYNVYYPKIYQAPELIELDGEIDNSQQFNLFAADLYALGITLLSFKYHMISNNRTGNFIQNNIETCKKSKDLSGIIINYLLEANPKQRLQNTKFIQSDIHEFLLQKYENPNNKSVNKEIVSPPPPSSPRAKKNNNEIEDRIIDIKQCQIEKTDNQTKEGKTSGQTLLSNSSMICTAWSALNNKIFMQRVDAPDYQQDSNSSDGKQSSNTKLNPPTIKKITKQIHERIQCAQDIAKMYKYTFQWEKASNQFINNLEIMKQQSNKISDSEILRTVNQIWQCLYYNNELEDSLHYNEVYFNNIHTLYMHDEVQMAYDHLLSGKLKWILNHKVDSSQDFDIALMCTEQYPLDKAKILILLGDFFAEDSEISAEQYYKDALEILQAIILNPKDVMRSSIQNPLKQKRDSTTTVQTTECDFESEDIFEREEYLVMKLKERTQHQLGVIEDIQMSELREKLIFLSENTSKLSSIEKAKIQLDVANQYCHQFLKYNEADFYYMEALNSLTTKSTKSSASKSSSKSINDGNKTTNDLSKSSSAQKSANSSSKDRSMKKPTLPSEEKESQQEKQKSNLSSSSSSASIISQNKKDLIYDIQKFRIINFLKMNNEDEARKMIQQIVIDNTPENGIKNIDNILQLAIILEENLFSEYCLELYNRCYALATVQLGSKNEFTVKLKDKINKL